MQPLVSVIVPVYNRGYYLAEAINSVLAQTFQQFELIVIDDGSTEGILAIVEKYGPRIRYHYQDNQGVSSAVNKGIALASGKYIAFIDSDDLWVQDKLVQQFNIFQKDSMTDIVFGYVEEFISPELSEEDKLKLHCSLEPLPWYTRQTTLVNRDVFDRVGMFDIELTAGSFIEWYVRAKSHNVKIKLLESVVCRRRIHLTNFGITHRQNCSEYIEIAKMNLEYERKRKLP